jgi:hypothetical protein
MILGWIPSILIATDSPAVSELGFVFRTVKYEGSQRQKCECEDKRLNHGIGTTASTGLRDFENRFS